MVWGGVFLLDYLVILRKILGFSIAPHLVGKYDSSMAPWQGSWFFPRVVGDVWFLSGVVGFFGGLKDEQKKNRSPGAKETRSEDEHLWEYCLKIGRKKTQISLPETNIAPENRPFQKWKLIFQTSIFRCWVFVFREDIALEIGRSFDPWQSTPCKKRASRSVKRVSLISTSEISKSQTMHVWYISLHLP